jgi:aminoglycoside phosphotransferase
MEGRPQTRVAERALQAWNRLSADQRTALNLRSRDFARTELNNEIRSLALTALREVGIPNISLDEVRREVEQ